MKTIFSTWSLFLTYYLVHLSLCENEKFKACRVYFKDCGEIQPGREAVRYLQYYYGKCKFILGNLVICDLKRLENGSDPDLSFLELIEEVSGYVYISRNEVKTIPLKSLRIIRGDSSYRFKDHSGSLIVTRNVGEGNKALETIDLRNLTAIHHHSVIVKDNPLLCNFAFTVSWEELFLDPFSQRYIPDRTNTSISQRECNITQIYQSCDGACAMVNAKGYCWGPGPALCQKMVKCHNDATRACVDGPISEELCDEECLGGCEGSPNKCRGCKNVENNGKCVSQCPPQFIVSRVDSRTIPNPDFKYTYNYECVDDCPAPHLKSKSYCVIECDLSNEIPVNGICQPCPSSGCPEHCKQDMIFDSPERFILDTEALEKLKNCAYYTGMLYISSESFNGGRLVQTPIKDVALLWNLHNLQSIVGRVYFDFRGALPDLTNLTFLENVRSMIYEVQGSVSGTVLQIMNGENVEMLGFRSLNKIDGAVFMANMSKLCYLDALEKLTPIRKRSIATKETCIARSAVCHSECLPQAGCWGPGSNMCSHCCNLQAGDACVSLCTDRPGFYEVVDSSSPRTRLLQASRGGNEQFCLTLPLNETQMSDADDAYIRFSKLPAKQCARCHPECAETCHGPGAHECIGKCKHFQDGDECVALCPKNTYAQTNTQLCLPCSAVCNPKYLPPTVPHCSGPGAFFGIGGCTACLIVIRNLTSQRFECMSDDCPPKHYKESHKTLDFVKRESIFITKDAEDLALGIINVCKPCHPYCAVCTASGAHVSTCQSCLHWWFRAECVKECPPAETYTINEEASEAENTTITPPLVTSSPDAEKEREKRAIDAQMTNTNSSIASTEDNGTPDTKSILLLQSTDPTQRHCLLCHDECVQGCSGPGPEDCVKCRNYKIMIDAEKNKFVCKSACPPDQSHVFHSMCLTSAQYDKMSGRSARELRDRILIAVAVSVIVLITVTTVLLIVCLKRRAEAERIREKLFSAYTNLDVSDKESLLKNQSGIREPNMGRLEMISADELEYDSTDTPLGTGAFGVVFRGIWRLSKAALLKHGCPGPQKFDVAIKVIQNDHPITPGMINPSTPKAIDEAQEEAWRVAARANVEELLQEAKVMASVEHKHCLPLIGLCLTRDRHCLVTMFLELGSLDRYVKEQREKLNSLTLLTWASQIADGMSYLEMRGIIHRDLAARNVLVQRSDLVQITDFGLAKMLERRDEDSVVVRAGRVPIRWLAIETLQDSIYSHKTDVWAYGVTLWEIFTYGRRPYEDVDTKDIKDHVMKGGRLTQPDICTLDVYMVMVKCWMEDYESRPTFIELTRTFKNFCQTPGRYLYIPGDRYAIHYPTSNNFGSITSTDTHELRPLLSPRGVPDGSGSAKVNGSLGGRGSTLGTASRYPPRFYPTSDSDGHQQQLDDRRLMRLASEEEPDESESLLPVRNASSSIWPLRSRGQGVGSAATSNEGGKGGHMFPSSAAPKSSARAPLASREDSWLAQAPSSPSWRSFKDDTGIGERSPVQISPTSSFPHAGAIYPIPPSPFGLTKSVGAPDSSNRTFSNQPSSLIPKPSDDLDYLWTAPKAPATPVEGYLEPKPTSFGQGFQRTPSNPPASGVHERPNTGFAFGGDYLIPKMNSPKPDDTSIDTTLAISNMEYFMQAYPQSTNDSATAPSDPDQRDKTGTIAD